MRGTPFKRLDRTDVASSAPALIYAADDDVEATQGQSMNASLHGGLHGIRIVECAQDIAGSYTAMLLAEQGADVIKVEPPGGDRARGLPGFAVWNRSKRAVVADPSSAAGRERLRALCASADVFISDGCPAPADLRYDMLAAAVRQSR